MTKSNLVLHAESELKLAGMFDKDADYGGALAPVIIKIVEEFSKHRHSGMSAQITADILNKLLRFKTLTPITDKEDEWMKVNEEMTSGDKLWQNKRDPRFFSKNNGKTWYNVED